MEYEFVFARVVCKIYPELDIYTLIAKYPPFA